MKVLQSCLKSFTFFGISPPSSLNDYLINKRNSLVLFIFYLNAISGVVFFACEAETMAEYADSFSVAWSIILSIVDTSILIYRIRDVFKFIERLEGVISKSKVFNLQSFNFVYSSLTHIF